MEAKTVSQSQVMMTEMVLPTHTNSMNTAFGGTIMSWIDVCAAIAAGRHSCRPCVTASLDELHFLAPVHTGWVVTLKGSVNAISRTSMEVGVRVEAESGVDSRRFHTASAYLTFVALDDNGAPMPVPPLIAESEDEKKRMRAAEARRQLRLEHREKMKKYKK